MARRVVGISVAALLCSGRALADAEAQSTNPAPGGTGTTSAIAATSAPSDLDEIVVHGIRRGDLILPTTVSSSAAFGLDLGVMDTPRNNTLLSKAQLDALNVQNPGAFSFLTSSSYTDASFGQPNVPRIRGQYADMFFNGMRDSFTLNGYGAPISFNSVDSIDIVKGPASVQGGPGAGVGGSINIVTKLPSLTKSSQEYNIEFDTQQKRRVSADVGGPLAGNVAGRISATIDDSGSFYYGMYFHQQAVFGSLLDQVTPKLNLLFTAGVENTTYRENDGINRVNQALIDNNTYLVGGVVGGPGNISGFGSQLNLTGTTTLPARTIIDEPAGTGARALHIKLQGIETYKASDAFTVVNNTFFDYMNRYNQAQDYYADTAKGSYSIENKTDFKTKFNTGSWAQDLDAGFTYRYTHVLDIQNFVNEPVSVADLSTAPANWIIPSSIQAPSGAFLYNAAFGNPQWGIPGRYQGPPGPDGYYVGGFLNGTADSNLQDAAVFLEDQVKFSPKLSLLFGVREDLVQLNYSDPLGGADYGAPPGYSALPQSASTAWYGLWNANGSLVYTPTQHFSLYGTYNRSEYVLPTANDGAISTWGVDPSLYLRQRTLLDEVGVKFDLFDKALFISAAAFYQERSVSTGPSAANNSLAHIKGAEIETNFQPNTHFFATASYSYLHTTLDTPAGFYNFPAVLGLNNDGAGTDAIFQPGQTFKDPGVPEHLFNVLVNYKHASGWGAQSNLQVTGPVETTQSGYLNLAAMASTYPGLTADNLASLGPNGYYQSPVIHWQYTLNGSVFYTYQRFTGKLSIYNLTNRRNLTNDTPFYGNDFITQQPSRDFDFSFTIKL